MALAFRSAQLTARALPLMRVTMSGLPVAFMASSKASSSFGRSRTVRSPPWKPSGNCPRVLPCSPSSCERDADHGDHDIRLPGGVDGRFGIVAVVPAQRGAGDGHGAAAPGPPAAATVAAALAAAAALVCAVASAASRKNSTANL